MLRFFYQQKQNFSCATSNLLRGFIFFSLKVWPEPEVVKLHKELQVLVYYLRTFAHSQLPKQMERLSCEILLKSLLQMEPQSVCIDA